jgi:(2Fe-2S) ferredoxin
LRWRCHELLLKRRSHIFFCLNQRDEWRGLPANSTEAAGGLRPLQEAREGLGLAGPGQVRVNKAGCLDRCAGGPVAVVYPEGTWYTFVDQHDIDEIVDSHLKNGQVVERLLLPPDVGR